VLVERGHHEFWDAFFGTAFVLKAKENSSFAYPITTAVTGEAEPERNKLL
jgi:hypothetical protein